MEFVKNLKNLEDCFPIGSWDAMYHKNHVRTQVTTAFLNFTNLEYLIRAIQDKTAIELNTVKKVLVETNSLLFDYVSSVLEGYSNYADVVTAVRDLNTVIIKKQSHEYVLELRQRGLYQKWFIYKDRPLVMPRPENTFGRKRLQGLSNGNYALRDPRSNQFEDFRKTQYTSLKIPEMFKPEF